MSSSSSSSLSEDNQQQEQQEKEEEKVEIVAKDDESLSFQIHHSQQQQPPTLEQIEQELKGGEKEGGNGGDDDDNNNKKNNDRDKDKEIKVDPPAAAALDPPETAAAITLDSQKEESPSEDQEETAPSPQPTTTQNRPSNSASYWKWMIFVLIFILLLVVISFQSAIVNRLRNDDNDGNNMEMPTTNTPSTSPSPPTLVPTFSPVPPGTTFRPSLPPNKFNTPLPTFLDDDDNEMRDFFTFEELEAFVRSTFPTVYWNSTSKPPSPQYAALKWIVGADQLESELYQQTIDEDDLYYHILQRYVLAVLYFSTNGPSWGTIRYAIDNYMELYCDETYDMDSDELLISYICRTDYGDQPWVEEGYKNRDAYSACTWGGIRCNSNRQVQSINLEHIDNVYGTLPQELSFFHQSLEVLVTGDNKEVTQDLWKPWTIPDMFNQLTQLRILDLSNQRNDGSYDRDEPDWEKWDEYPSIPHNIDRLWQLQYFDISFNNFTGTIPSTVGRWGNLQQFHCHFNNLIGYIPSELLYSTQLQELDLGHNFLSGSIPSQVNTLANLHYLDVSHNMLTGSIPGPFPFSMEYLNISNNYLTGTIPTLQQNFHHVDMSYNNLRGTIPATLARMTLLTTLRGHFNQLSGSLPTELIFVTSLQEINFQSNQLTGSISEEFCQELRAKGDLEIFVLDCTKVVCPCCTNSCGPTSAPSGGSGFKTYAPSLPPYFRPPTSSPTIPGPPTSTNRTQLESIIISISHDQGFSALQDPYTYQYAAFKWLNEIYQQGSVDPNDDIEFEYSIIQQYVLAIVHIRLNGAKWDYRNYFELKYNELDCSDGQLYTNLTCGTYGDQEWPIQNFVGTLPLDHCTWAGIQCDEKDRVMMINLKHIDNVYGSLPHELFALNKSLQGLVTGENYDMTTGLWLPWNFRTSLGNLRNLRILDLSNIITGTPARDNVYGTIPTNFGANAPLMQYLDFSANYMRGTLPDSLGLMTNLVTLKGDFNNFEGVLPLELIKLTALRELDFRENSLRGTVSGEFCSSLRELKIFALDCIDEIECPCCTYCSPASPPAPVPMPTSPSATSSPSFSIVPTSAYQWDERQPPLQGDYRGAFFGSTVSIATLRDRVAVGATAQAGIDVEPYVRVYDWDGNSWLKLGQTLNFADGEQLSSVELSDAGDILSVVTHTINLDFSRSRNVRIFTYVGEEVWTEMGLAIIVTENLDKEYNVSGVGNDATLSYGVTYGTVVSVRTDTRVSTFYYYEDGTWRSLGSDIFVRARLLSSSLDGLVVAVCEDPEQVRIFEYNRDSQRWQQRGQTIQFSGRCDSLSLSGDGNVIAVGDRYFRNAGRVQVFDFIPARGEWVQNGRDILGEEFAEYLGSSISLSADGTTLAVAADGHNGRNFSDFSELEDSGVVRVYKHWNGQWYNMCCDIDGLSTYEYSGYLSLSSDGKKLAIGSPSNDDNGEQSGNCRIFDLLGGIPTR